MSTIPIRPQAFPGWGLNQVTPRKGTRTQRHWGSFVDVNFILPRAPKLEEDILSYLEAQRK